MKENNKCEEISIENMLMFLDGNASPALIKEVNECKSQQEFKVLLESLMEMKRDLKSNPCIISFLEDSSKRSYSKFKSKF